MLDGIERPNLNGLDAEVKVYVEALEAEVARLSSGRQREPAGAEPAAPSEPPTSLNLITISDQNTAKRSPRHLYSRQRRGGMGVFDLESREGSQASTLAVADDGEGLLLFSNFGRAFALPVSALSESPVRARGNDLADLLPFRPHERIVAALPQNGGAYVALASHRGWIRRVRANYLGKNLIPGMSFHDVKEGGYLTAACWTEGDGDLFMATQQGKGIRFMESQVPARGCLGMRVHIEDRVVAVAAVYPDSGVFLLGADGKGTVRLMTGFSANKAPGAGGKIAMKSDRLVGGVTVSDGDDVFIASQLNKIVRFSASEVPAKTGAVQGVNCISLRRDEATTVVASR